jgi:predicted nucleotidyltransferase
MRSTFSPQDVFGTRSRVSVLGVLHGVNVPMNASRIAAQAGLSKPAAASALDELARMGLVGRATVGQSSAYWLERENAYVQEMVNPVFGSEEGLPDTLLEDLGARFSEGSISVVLFGSYARGDQQPDSDVDVVLVASDEASQARLDELYYENLSDFRRRFGAPLSVLTYDASEAKTLWQSAPALQESLETEGIVVSGLAPYEWRDIDDQA